MTDVELSTTIEETLDGHVLAAARIYLDVAGPATRAELVRVIASHLEISPDGVNASIGRLTSICALQLAETTVSLPAGGGVRETEEN